MTRNIILILSADTLGAALLGGAVEHSGLEPYYPQPDETARAALRRTRPVAVLIDCRDPEACAESFVGPALMTGARVILVRSPGGNATVPAAVARLGLPTIELPRDADRLSDIISG